MFPFVAISCACCLTSQLVMLSCQRHDAQMKIVDFFLFQELGQQQNASWTRKCLVANIQQRQSRNSLAHQIVNLCVLLDVRVKM